MLPSIQIGHGDKALCLDVGGKVRAVSHLTPQVKTKYIHPGNAYMLVESK